MKSNRTTASMPIPTFRRISLASKFLNVKHHELIEFALDQIGISKISNSPELSTAVHKRLQDQCDLTATGAHTDPDMDRYFQRSADNDN